MAKEKPTKIATKKHLARLERERRQTQLITYIAIGLVVIIAGLIGYGILNDTVLKPLRPIVTVNGESVSVREFEVRVKVTRQSDIDQYMQYYQFAQMFGIDTSSTSSISTTLQNLESSLSTPTTIGNQVLQDITNDLLIRQYAKANGIVVTAADLDKAIQDAFGYFPNGTPTATLTGTPFAYSTLSATQYALVTATLPPTLVPTGTLSPTQTPGLTGTPVPTATITLTSTVTPIPSLTPTSTPYTLTGFNGRYKDALTFYGKLGMTEADFRKIYFESNLYRTRVTNIITADVAHDQDMVWARHILVADEATAKSIRQQLIDGADFATLAAQSSLDTGSKSAGGDLGWFAKGAMLPEFETSAYSLKIGEISQPVQTSAGWHIIQVLGHEVRPLTDKEYQTAVANAMSAWLLKQRTAANIVIASDWTTNIPTTPSLTDAFNSLYATATAFANIPPAIATVNPAQTTPTP
jgi:peptidyl-prolyl cis-trans isomerase D